MPDREVKLPSLGLAEGGIKESKLSRRRASRAASGVFVGPGVRAQAPATCAGLGVMLRKSAKLRLVPGVARPNAGNAAPLPPGVDIIEDGSGVDFVGGVEGGITRVRLPGFAGVGELARWISKFASSSPDTSV